MGTSSFQMDRHRRRIAAKRRTYAKSMPKPLPGEITRTYEEWKATGFQVMQGEKAMGRNRQGIAIFGQTQVKPANTRRWGKMDDLGDYDEDMMIDDYIMDIGDR